MERIIKIEPVNKVFSINWFLGPRCNYDCMYCPSKWHDTTSKHLSFSELCQVWESIFEKSKHLGLKYKIVFTGGEATSNKSLMPFLTWLRKNYSDHLGQILLTTNGSANYKYYAKLFELVDNVSFSVHSEFVDEKKFFGIVKQLSETLPKDKFIHVNVMNEYWNQDRITMYVKYLEMHGISYSVNEVDYSLKTREHPDNKGKLNFEF